MMSMADYAKAGLPLADVPIIDEHNHLGRWSAFYVPGGGTIDQMVRRMDQVGISKICVTAHASIGPDYVYGNNLVMDALQRHPDRVVGYVTVNPNYPEDMQHELDRCFAVPGFRAIKFHPECHNQPVDCKGYESAFEEAEKRACPILIHVWGDEAVHAVDGLAPRFPHAVFIMAHMGGTDGHSMEKAVDVINRHTNVYGDVALSRPTDGNIEWLVKEIGSRRLLFGTDMPFYDPSHVIARVALSEISEEEKRDVFYRNAARIMKLDDPEYKK